jgi:hypothetical protein
MLPFVIYPQLSHFLKEIAFRRLIPTIEVHINEVHCKQQHKEEYCDCEKSEDNIEVVHTVNYKISVEQKQMVNCGDCIAFEIRELIMLETKIQEKHFNGKS